MAMITISRAEIEEVAAYDDFETDYFANNPDRLAELAEQEYGQVRELEDLVAGFWSEEESWRRASLRAFERMAEEARDLWEAETNGPLRQHIRRLRQQAEDREREAKRLYQENCTLRVRLDEDGKPPPCTCGAISYTVECSRCRRVLRGDGWQEA